MLYKQLSTPGQTLRLSSQSAVGQSARRGIGRNGNVQSDDSPGLDQTFSWTAVVRLSRESGRQTSLVMFQQLQCSVVKQLSFYVVSFHVH